ncbi:MAG: hypothetical protein MUO72_08575 [Bacteroidales bacterium]|nr:hypothetical protein [Bacteroidales bacterium]
MASQFRLKELELSDLLYRLFNERYKDKQYGISTMARYWACLQDVDRITNLKLITKDIMDNLKTQQGKVDEDFIDYYVFSSRAKLFSKEGNLFESPTKFKRLPLTILSAAIDKLNNEVSKLEKVPVLINKESAKKFFDSTVNAELCVFFDTKNNIQEWFDPKLQFHLAIQKSIEQSRNYLHILRCHKMEFENSISTCRLNPPKRMHLRVIFLPITKDELIPLIKSNGHQQKSLANLILLHVINSIPLALLTIESFADIIKRNKEFFYFPEKTKPIGMQKISEAFLSKKNLMIQIKEYLKSNAREAIDFMMYRLEADSVFTDLWGGKINEYNEIEYFKYEDTSLKERAINEARRNFGKIIFDEVSCSEPFNEVERIEYISEIDPINYFINSIGDQKVQISCVKTEYCANNLFLTYSK